ncbi:hypothetical protein OFM13_28615, partial [Escherichia coli]|nr:hypothetical protein [Escherichia coli]
EMRIVFYPLINRTIHHRFSRGNVGIVLIPAPLWEKVNAWVTLAECRPDKAFTPHPALVVGCDAGASYPTYSRCQM